MNNYYNEILIKLNNKEYFSTKRNNILIKTFIDSKFNGGYGRLLFEKSINSEDTALKKIRNLKKIDDYFKKDFDKITEKELIIYRDLLNNDKIFSYQTIIEHIGKVKKVKVVNTTNPLSYRTKQDYKTNFIEFYRFVMEFVFQESKKELQDITKYFKLKRPDDFEEIKVEFIPPEKLTILLNNIKNINLKSMIQLSLMSGARKCEILKVKYGDGNNLYKNNDGKWVIKLPKIKRVSYKKMPFVIDMYEDELYPFFDRITKKMKSGDLVFNITPQTFTKLMKHYTIKYIDKHYSPKTLRKTARMIRTNAGYTYDWINKLMGHAPGSKIQGHYINYEGIDDEPEANERLKGKMYPSLKQDYDTVKLQLQAQDQQMNEMKEQMNQLVIMQKIKDKVIKKKT